MRPVLLLLLLVLPTGAATRFVNRQAAAGGDGTSWSTAFTHLQDALRVAEEGDEVWVAAGTYKPDEGTEQSPRDRAATFLLEDGVALYGGFAGDESDREERDPESHLSILSGDIGVSGGANSLHVITIERGAGPGTILDGIHVRDGYASNTSTGGGGLLCEGASPLIAGCRFENNSTLYRGGAVRCSDAAGPTFDRCRFARNHAREDGGAVYADASSSLVFTNCLFTDHDIDGRGAALFLSSANATFRNCVLRDNHATSDGGAIYHSRGTLAFTNCTLLRNRSGNNGGGLRIVHEVTATFQNTILWDNSARDDSTTTSATLYLNTNSSCSFESCLVANSGGSAGWNMDLGTDLGGNLDTDPLFRSTGDQRPRGGSPAINAGTNAASPDPVDLAGTPRILEGAIDLGAYEFDPAGLTPNLDAPTALTVIGEAGLVYREMLDLPELFDAVLNTVEVIEAAPALQATITPGLHLDLEGTDEFGVFPLRLRVTSGARTTLYELQVTALPPALRVNQMATGKGDGTSWPDAFPSLQEALAIADRLEPGFPLELWVVRGTYLPTSGDDRMASFALQSGIELYGGFAGAETMRSERDPISNPSILSGNLGEASRVGDNSVHVVTAFGTGRSAILDGFTITGGAARFARVDPLPGGGGLLCDNASPTIANCRFAGNETSEHGGAVHLRNGATPQFVDCFFTQNVAERLGGAVYLEQSAATFLRCAFVENRGVEVNSGGAVATWESSGPVTFTNCAFLGNTTERSGAALSNHHSTIELTNCSLVDNEAESIGGAISNHESTLRMTNSLLWKNRVGGNESLPESSLQSTSSTVEISHSLVANSGGSTNWVASVGTDFGGNLDLDPRILSRRDPRLRSDSPLIDAGSSLAVAGDLDLDGQPRLVGGALDLGAHEYTTAVLEPTRDAPATLRLLARADLEFENLPDLEDIFGRPLDSVSLTSNSNPEVVGIAVAPNGAITLTPTGSRGEAEIVWEVAAGPARTSYSLTLSFLPPVRYLNAESNVAGDGRSWAQPFVSLRTALDNLPGTSHGPSQQLWVASGTYRPSGSPGDTFHLKSGLALYGGFSGGESERSERNPDPATNGTLLSGAIGGPDSSDNTLHLLIAESVDATCIVDGFSIAHTTRSALRCTRASPRFERCLFRDNRAAANGGAVTCHDHSSPSFLDCTFEGNFVSTIFFPTPGIQTYSGGAIYCQRFSDPLFERCLFSRNRSTYRGGAVEIRGSSSPQFRSCTFDGNRASHIVLPGSNVEEARGGAVAATNGCHPSFLDCHFSGNESTGEGGALHLPNQSTATLHRCTFRDNLAALDGGAVNTRSDDTVLTACLFDGNHSDTRGGALANLGADTRVSDCLFIRNTAEELGAAIFNHGSGARILNCTVARNTTRSPGGAIANLFSSATLLNCLVWNNHAPGADPLASSVSNDSSTLTVGHSLVAHSGGSGAWREEAGTDLGSNLDLDPQFRFDPPTGPGDYRLRSTSPALDAGDDTATDSLTDLEGAPRVLPGSTIDLGAYEYDPAVLEPAHGLPTVHTLLGRAGEEYDNIPDLTTLFGQPLTEVSLLTNSNPALAAVSVSPAGIVTIGPNGPAGSTTLEFRVSNGTASTTLSVEVRTVLPVVHVHQSAAGATNGTSWADAFPTLESALRAAPGTSTGPAQEVWVARGTYVPSDTDDRNTSITLRDGLALYGGFAGDETERGTRNPDPLTNGTVLSGDLGVLQDGTTGQFDNSFLILQATDVGASALLDGFTITRGSGSEGAGLRCLRASPTIRHCFFTENTAETGAAIHNSAFSSPTIERCRFTLNWAVRGSDKDGGAIFNRTSSSPRISQCTFEENEAQSQGGALYYADYSAPLLTDCHFANNRGAGTAVSASQCPKLQFVRCSFTGGTASRFPVTVNIGGCPEGILDGCTFSTSGNVRSLFVSGADLTLSGCRFTGPGPEEASDTAFSLFGSTVWLDNCVFDRCSTRSVGAALRSSDSTLLLTGSSFTRNSADSVGGALDLRTSRIEIIGCTFKGNRSAGGGAAYLRDCPEVRIDRCTFESNAAGELGSGGGSLYLEGCDSTITASRFAGNTATASGGGVAARSNLGLEFANCAFQGNYSEQWGGGLSFFEPTTSVVLAGCTFSGNNASLGGGAIHQSGSSVHRNGLIWNNAVSGSLLEPSASLSSLANASFSHCLIQHRSASELNGSDPAAGNLDGTEPANDPLFLSPVSPTLAPTLAGALFLREGSPARDVGDNTASPGPIDLAGAPRIQNGTVDLGAYESGLAPAKFALLHPGLDPDGDANGNGLTNYADYAAGTDPTAAPDPSAHPVAGYAEGATTWSHTRRTGAVDVFTSYERSTDLAVFVPLVEGADYEVLAIRPLSPGRELVEIRLLPVDPVPPQIFLRQITRSVPIP